ncbi:MAG: DNA mismatch repair protein [Halolamina sp.]
MRLESFWGVGPKTAATLREELGAERAVEAIESADVRALVDAGVTRGRATRILRRANGEAGMELFGTADARDVYDDLVSLAATYALTDHAADRIRVLTPLPDRDDARERLDEVLAARDAWASLSPADRRGVVEAFDRYDEADDAARAAVEAALALRRADLTGEVAPELADAEASELKAAAEALGSLTGDRDALLAGDDPGELRVADGADDELDRLRERLSVARELEAGALDVLQTAREAATGGEDAFRSAVVDHVARETGVGTAEVRAVTPSSAADSADFVTTTLRALGDDIESRVDERAETVRSELRATVRDVAPDVRAAVGAVDDVALSLSLGRFAADNDLVRPTLGGDRLAVRDARNLTLGGDVQPVTYAVGEHGLSEGVETEAESVQTPLPPTDDRVTVVTGANSGGKTTLLETLCQVAVLSAMGLPVPAAAAEVGGFDTVVFHRRHASFNAGVLESTLQNILPPLTDDGRTLMLVDEFEAITEPGRAADLLNGLLDETVERDALGVYVTHLAEDLEPLPAAGRVDGVFAEGLTGDLELRVDYQPRFGTVGKSTPEFIVSRLIADADDPEVRTAFRSLASAVGQEAVQRTLSDAEWTG